MNSTVIGIIFISILVITNFFSSMMSYLPLIILAILVASFLIRKFSGNDDDDDEPKSKKKSPAGKAPSKAEPTVLPKEDESPTSEAPAQEQNNE